jgi:L-cystine uptake protein TcyP (sodium:dicarboxylate symporter family)
MDLFLRLMMQTIIEQLGRRGFAGASPQLRAGFIASTLANPSVSSVLFSFLLLQAYLSPAAVAEPGGRRHFAVSVGLVAFVFFGVRGASWV